MGIAFPPLFAALALVACDGAPMQLRIYPPAYQQLDTEHMEAIFEKASGISLISMSPEPGLSGLDALVAQKTDLGLVENSASFVAGLRAVLPTYQSVLHLLIRDSFEPPDVNQPLRGAVIYIAGNSSAGRAFVEVVAARQGLGAGEYTISPALEPGKTDIVIYFGPIDANSSTWYHPGYELISLNNQQNPQRRLFQEGIGYMVPKMKPMVIPPFTYALPGNEKEIMTVGVDTLLVTRKAVPEAIIYKLTKALVEQKPRFMAISPHMFAGIKETFDPLDLNFPLHSGARRYLERDEPGMLERYAESINLLMYMGFLVLTGFVAFSRWRAHRKKDRIDRFYIRILAIRERASTEQHTVLLRELKALEGEAFTALVEEKLAADESFRIFTDLLARIRTELSG